MKTTRICACLVMLCILCSQLPVLAGNRPNGEDYAAPDGSLVTHAALKEFPMEGEPNFMVTVNGKAVGLYNDRSHWGGLVEFGSFEFLNGKEITIRITYAKGLKSFEVLPLHSLDLLSVQRTGRNTIEIRTARADQNITVVVNGEPRKDVLHLFCNSVDRNAPKVKETEGYHRYEEERLHYFGPGFHDLRAILGDNDMLVLESGWRVYMAAGAVLYGRIGMWGAAKGTKVHGRGMIYNDTDNPHVVFEANDCQGADVEGILMHAHRPGVWQVVVNHCSNVEFKGVKILSTRYASTDGLDIVNSQQCAFLNTFIRANDDAIAIKGLDNRPPAQCPPTRNLTFCGMQLWNDCNCAMGIGAENHCSLYENIRFMNSSILFSYDDPDYHEMLDERAALTICCIHGTYFRNISYENVDVYHCERLIAAGFQPSFWFGALPGDQSTPGGMENILYRNVTSYADSGSRIANHIRLYGWTGTGTPAKEIRGVTLDNVMIRGNRVSSTADPHLRIGPLVHGVSFGGF
ncbi:MAG: glycosyl hydrolase family 28 protein [Bacteroidaceae bacterium]